MLVPWATLSLWAGRADAEEPPEASTDHTGATPSSPFTELRPHHVFTYEIRAQAVATVLGLRHFEAGGTCMTGHGLAPVSIYGHNGEGHGFGAGVGLGARGGYLFLLAPKLDERSFLWGLRAGAGVDIDLLYLHSPTGIPDASGELCQRVQASKPNLREESGSLLLLQIPLQLGAHLGFGSFQDAETWSGAVVGVAFAPSLLHLEPSIGPRSTAFRWAGVEMTVDSVRLEAAPRSAGDGAHLRFALFVAPPTKRSEALLFKLSAGLVWY